MIVGSAPQSQQWLAPAKLNLFLHVTGRRDDGYHTLQTAFIFLDYYDYLTFELNKSGRITRIDLENSIDLALPEDDLCVLAARLLQQTANVSQGVTIYLRKRIPAGAGLGGGSSDAATVLIALNQLWQAGLSHLELIELARQLGADVPVFVHGENTLAEGVGDLFQPLAVPEQIYCVLIPQIHVSTAHIFSDSSLTRDTPIKTIRGSLPPGLTNDLQAVTCRQYPVVKQALQYLQQFGEARMSGTGASVFLPCDTLKAAEKIYHEWPARKNGQLNGFVARSLLRHPHK